MEARHSRAQYTSALSSMARDSAAWDSQESSTQLPCRYQVTVLALNCHWSVPRPFTACPGTVAITTWPP